MDQSSRLAPRHDPPYGTPKLTPGSIAYIVINVLWTSTVLVGLGALYACRGYDCIRKRNPALIITFVLTIHVYLSTNMIIYPLNGAYPCAVNYWIMSIYFPLGIALFQVQNVLLLSVSALQRDLKYQTVKRPQTFSRNELSLRGIRRRWKEMTLLSRIYHGIAVAVALQLVMSFTIFFISRKFVSFGRYGSHQSNKLCTQGWEWIPTILYQGIWTYGFGPWLLFKIRHIHDVFHWKLQTVLAIVFSLPGLPIWLAATNSPAFKKVKVKFPNGMWFTPGIFMMELVSIGFPLYEVYKARRRQGRSPSATAFLKAPLSALESGTNGTTTLASQTTTTSTTPSTKTRTSIQAFEFALRTRSGDLLEYAATREFTGENIIFLVRVRDWKAEWSRLTSANAFSTTSDLDRRRRLFATAADIFAKSVSIHTSQFPLNIESHIYVALATIFAPHSVSVSSRGGGVRHLRQHHHASVVAPFADPSPGGSLGAPKSGWEVDTDDGVRPSVNESTHELTSPDDGGATIPDGFDVTVFDAAEQSVKYMVFTNTWARYVDSWRSSSSSTITEEVNVGGRN